MLAGDKERIELEQRSAISYCDTGSCEAEEVYFQFNGSVSFSVGYRSAFLNLQNRLYYNLHGQAERLPSASLLGIMRYLA